MPDSGSRQIARNCIEQRIQPVQIAALEAREDRGFVDLRKFPQRIEHRLRRRRQKDAVSTTISRMFAA